MIGIILILIITNTEAARILAVFPTPCLSHQIVFKSLTHELARRGHDVTVITTNPVFPKGEAIQNLTEIDVKEISYKHWYKKPTPEGKPEEFNLEETVKSYLRIITNAFSDQLNSSDVTKLIKDVNIDFDLLIVEAQLRPTLALSHRFKVPVIRFASLGNVFDEYDTMGSIGHPLLYPSVLFDYLYNLNTWDKITEIYNRLLITKMHYSLENEENEVMRAHFGADMPPLSNLANNIDLMLMNVYRVWEMNRPSSLNIIQVGGIHLNGVKLLSEDLQNYLDSSIYGVIYISFGTNVAISTLPSKQVDIIVDVMSRLPYDVLWKWDSKEPPGPKNIKTEKWFPQEQLLKHPKIKGFITQGGLQSTEEAISAGVPLIGIPTAADQFFNVKQYVHLKIGVMLPLQTFSEKDLEDAIDNVVVGENYRQNIQTLGSQLRDAPLTPIQRAVWWTEHILHHEGRHLRSPAHNMPWAEYLEIELALIILSCFVLLLFMTFIFVKKIVTYLVLYK